MGKYDELVGRLLTPCFERGLDEGWIDKEREQAATAITTLEAELAAVKARGDRLAEMEGSMTPEEVWREASAAYEDTANDAADLPMRDMVIAGDAAATAILAQRDAEMLAEGARRERERVVEWLEGLHWTHRHYEPAKSFAQAIAAGQHEEKNDD
jgi:hypothetical protein